MATPEVQYLVYISRSEKLKVMGELRMIREVKFTVLLGVTIIEFSFSVLSKNTKTKILVLAITEPT
jgi:hypothetical protein